MRHKIIAGVLVLALAISLGFNLYYYSVTVSKQATMNNMRGQIIVAWAYQMSYAAYYLENVTTNIDVHGVRYLFFSFMAYGRNYMHSTGACMHVK